MYWLYITLILFAVLSFGHLALVSITDIRLTFRRCLLIIDTQARLCGITARMIIHAATSPQECYLWCSDGGRWTKGGYVLCKRLILALHCGATVGGKPRKNDKGESIVGLARIGRIKRRKVDDSKILWKKCIRVISILFETDVSVLVFVYIRCYLFIYFV